MFHVEHSGVRLCLRAWLCLKGMKRKSNRQRYNSLRLAGHDYSEAGAYFITTCVHREFKVRLGRIQQGRARLNTSGRVVDAVWRQIPERYMNVEMDAFVVMPDHFHGILIIRRSESIEEYPEGMNKSSSGLADRRRHMLLPRVIGYFKMNAAKKINEIHHRKGRVWQRGYHDQIIRSAHHLENVRRYIDQNPARWHPRTGDS